MASSISFRNVGRFSNRNYVSLHPQVRESRNQSRYQLIGKIQEIKELGCPRPYFQQLPERLRKMSPKLDAKLQRKPLEDIYQSIMPLQSYFHDGSIIDIQHQNDNIKLSIESSEISKEDLQINVILSKHQTLKGILHLENVQSIFIDGKFFHEKLEMLADSGEILDFEPSDNKLRLFVEWINFPPKEKIDKYSDITLKVEKIYWENFPNLFDPFR